MAMDCQKDTVGRRNPAPPKKPFYDDSPVNTGKPWFPMVSKWCRILSIHCISQRVGGQFFNLKHPLTGQQTIIPTYPMSFFFFFFWGTLELRMLLGSWDPLSVS